MNTRKEQWQVVATTFIIFSVLVLIASGTSSLQAQGRVQAMDENGAPLFQVNPFWPAPLPDRWSMQQVTGLYVDHMDHIWFLNRGNGVEGDEITQ